MGKKTRFAPEAELEIHGLVGAKGLEKGWVHTHGMVEHGLPELEILGVPDLPIATANTTFARGRAAIEFPNGHPECFVCGTCKRSRVLSHQAAGRAVVFGAFGAHGVQDPKAAEWLLGKVGITGLTQAVEGGSKLANAARIVAGVGSRREIGAAARSYGRTALLVTTGAVPERVSEQIKQYRWPEVEALKDKSCDASKGKGGANAATGACSKTAKTGGVNAGVDSVRLGYGGSIVVKTETDVATGSLAITAETPSAKSGKRSSCISRSTAGPFSGSMPNMRNCSRSIPPS